MILKLLSKMDRILFSLLNRYKKEEKGNIFEYSSIYKSSVFEGNNKVSERCKLINCDIGKYTYFNTDTKLFYTKVGRYSSIGSDVKNIRGVHPSSNYVSSHPIFYSLKKQVGVTYVDIQKFREEIYVDKEGVYCNYIGNDVWIGSNVIILEGVSISDGAIIAAGSVVTKDVPPYTIVGGVPAKEIKKRFSQDQIDFLMGIKWWNQSDEWIKKYADFYEDIEIFIKKVKYEKDY